MHGKRRVGMGISIAATIVFTLYFHTFRCSDGNVESKDQLKTMKRQKFQRDK